MFQFLKHLRHSWKKNNWDASDFLFYYWTKSSKNSYVYILYIRVLVSASVAFSDKSMLRLLGLALLITFKSQESSMWRWGGRGVYNSFQSIPYNIKTDCYSIFLSHWDHFLSRYSDIVDMIHVFIIYLIFLYKRLIKMNQ